MKSKLPCIALLVLAVPLLTPATSSAACSPAYESCFFAGCDLQILRDDGYESTSCSGAWIYSGNASRDYSSQCGHPFTGPYNTWTGELDTYGTSAIYQDVYVNDPQGYRTHLSVEIDLKTVGAANTYDKLKITIRNPSTNQILETLATINPNPSVYNCQPIAFYPQGNYYGQTIRLYLEAVNSQVGTSFIIDGARIWLTQ